MLYIYIYLGRYLPTITVKESVAVCGCMMHIKREGTHTHLELIESIVYYYYHNIIMQYDITNRLSLNNSYISSFVREHPPLPFPFLKNHRILPATEVV